MTTKELAKKTLYLNPNIKIISNSQIVEYDMKQAGFSLIKKYRMLPEHTILSLEKLGKKETAFDKKYGKHEQDIKIGKMQRENRELSEKLKVAFEIERENFIKKNQISEEDIIAIKKDAFFINTPKKIDGKIDEFINFRKKNIYTSYVYIKPFEIYYKYGQDLEIKGLGETAFHLHEDTMIQFIEETMRMIETYGLTSILYHFKKFIDDYKNLRLDTEYYREFNPQSKFQYLDGEYSDLEYRQDKSQLNILVNYQFIINFLSRILE